MQGKVVVRTSWCDTGNAEGGGSGSAVCEDVEVKGEGVDEGENL